MKKWTTLEEFREFIEDEEQAVNLSPIEKMLKDHFHEAFFSQLLSEKLIATSATCFPPDINLQTCLYNHCLSMETLNHHDYDHNNYTTFD